MENNKNNLQLNNDEENEKEILMEYNEDDLQFNDDEENNMDRVQFNEGGEMMDISREHKKEEKPNENYKSYVQRIKEELETIGKTKTLISFKEVKQYHQMIKKKVNKEVIRNWSLEDMFAKLSIQL